MKDYYGDPPAYDDDGQIVDALYYKDGKVRIREEYMDDAYPYFENWFVSSKDANTYAAMEMATGIELKAYVKENESDFAGFIKENMQEIYDYTGETAEQYKERLLREFAATDSMFYDWLAVEREKGLEKPTEAKGAA